MKLSLFIVLICFKAFALNSPFDFNNKTKLNLSEREFRVYIIPQLRSIHNEFFTLFTSLNPLYPELLKIQKALRDAQITSHQIIKSCKKSTLDCEKLHHKILGLFSKIETHLLNIENFTYIESIGKNSKKTKINGPKTLQEIYHWVEPLKKLYAQVVKTRVELERHHIFLSQDFLNAYDSLSAIDDDIQNITTQFLTLFFSLSDKDIGKLFSSVYYSFLRPIDYFVLRTMNDGYLKKEIEALNFSWNDFHARISKSNIKSSKETLKLISQMHRRWVSVLKIMLN